MEDPLKPARQALYDRVTGISLAGLFTRPAVLALEENMKGRLPREALNLVCRKLLDNRPVSGTDAAGMVLHAAGECGFTDPEQFSALFREATGWLPEEWYKRFGST